MATPYTVDASVFLSAFNSDEPGHADSQQFLSEVQDAAIPIVVPTLLLPELAAAVSRGQADADLAHRFSATVSRLPHIVLVPLDLPLARQATDLASQYALRGSDAVYAAVAYQFGSTLVTLDRQQRERVATAVPALWPAEALAR